MWPTKPKELPTPGLEDARAPMEKGHQAKLVSLRGLIHTQYFCTQYCD